jgi:hypothetical protein
MKRHAPAILAIIGGLLLLLPAGGGVPPVPPVSDVLAQCQAADRASKIALVQELAARTWPTDRLERIEAMTDWWLEQYTERRAADYEPFTDLVAVAIDAGTVVELAAELEGK